MGSVEKATRIVDFRDIVIISSWKQIALSRSLILSNPYVWIFLVPRMSGYYAWWALMQDLFALEVVVCGFGSSHSQTCFIMGNACTAHVAVHLWNGHLVSNMGGPGAHDEKGGWRLSSRVELCKSSIRFVALSRDGRRQEEILEKINNYREANGSEERKNGSGNERIIFLDKVILLYNASMTPHFHSLNNQNK